MERKFYNELKAQKEAGIKLDWDNVGRTELIQLWWHEVVYDEKIAELFEVTPNEVKKKRYDLGIKQHIMANRDYWGKVIGRMDEINYDDQLHPYNETDRVRKILDEIRELSTEEVNALILAGKDTVFRNLYADARFGHRLSIALTQR